jgi:hypothetical protein
MLCRGLVEVEVNVSWWTDLWRWVKLSDLVSGVKHLAHLHALVILKSRISYLTTIKLDATLHYVSLTL